MRYQLLFRFLPTTILLVYLTHAVDSLDDTLSRYNYEPIIRDCGGVFRIRPDTPIEIQYKLGRDYANYEFCVWSFVPDSPLTSYDFHLVEGTFESGYDGIAIYAWSGDGVISVVEQNKTTHSVRGDHVFMAFSSDLSTVHPGFRMRVTARSSHGSQQQPSTPSIHYSAVSLQQSEGRISLPNLADQGRSQYVSNERISAVLQFSKSSEGSYVDRTANITSLDTELDRDYLYAFPLEMFAGTRSGTFNLTGFSGNSYGAQIPIPEMSTGIPIRGILYLFKADESNNGEGFSLSWSMKKNDF